MDNDNKGFDLEDVLERLDSELGLVRYELHKSVEVQKDQNVLLAALIKELRERS